MVPALTRPMTLPPLKKYWYAFMTGVACDRNPSTSSGPWPPTHTVAPKFRKSWVCLRGWLTLTSQAGSATRSGSADGGGLSRVGTLAGSRGSVCPREPFGLPGRQQPGIGQHLPPLTTLTLTVVVAGRAGMWNRRVYTELMAPVTRYTPGGSFTSPPPKLLTKRLSAGLVA